jgi:HAE1 family hydrophobic/amphiphilic exporter-1
VVENVERKLTEGIPPKEAAYQTMDEVGTALISIALVLAAVFVPTAFISGITGQFYQQFALTITSATVISCIVSLTLSPALAAMILRPHAEHHDCTRCRGGRCRSSASPMVSTAASTGSPIATASSPAA